MANVDDEFVFIKPENDQRDVADRRADLLAQGIDVEFIDQIFGKEKP